MQITDDAHDALEAPDAPALEATPTADAVTTDTQEASEAQATSTLDRKLAKENQSLRKRLRDLEAQAKAKEEAELSEQERLQRRMIELQQQNEAMQAQARDASLRAQVASAATKFGIVDPDAAYRLLNVATLDYDDTDGWVGVEDALRALTHERPWLVTTATPSGAAANPTNPHRRRTGLTLDALRSMSDREIAALPADEVDAVLSGQQ